MLPIVLVGLFSAMVVGVVLLWLGVRGRRLNDHPICAWCRFDLDGVYPEGVTCPECGAGLKRERAVRIGARRRMASLIGAGLVLALAPLPPIGVVAFAALTGSDINKYKPVGLLLWEAKVADASRTATIANELIARALAKGLAPDQYALVIETALELQGNPARAWDEAWGNLIERAKLDGVLTASQEQRFERQSAVLEIRSRAKVHAGQKLPLRIVLKEPRVSSAGSVVMSLALDGAALGGTPVAASATERQGFDPFFGQVLAGPPGGSRDRDFLGTISASGSRAQFVLGLGMGDPELTLDVPASLEPGTYDLVVELDAECQGGRSGAITLALAGTRMRPGGGAPHKLRVATAIEVVPESEPVVLPVAATPELTAKLAAALTPGALTVSMPAIDQQGRLVSEPAGTAEFDTSSVPAPVAFDVFCRVGGDEWRLGSIDSSKRPPSGVGGFISTTMSITINGAVTRSNRTSGQAASVTGAIPGFDPATTRVDIVLRPSPVVAAQTTDLTSYYDGEIVFPDVPVVRDAFDGADPQLRRLFNSFPAVRPSSPARKRGAY